MAHQQRNYELWKIDSLAELGESYDKTREYLQANPFHTVYDTELEGQIEVVRYKVKFFNQVSQYGKDRYYLEMDEFFESLKYGELM